MSKSRFAQAALVVGVLLLASCAAGPDNVAQVNAVHLAGFWQGLWQGLISPITFLVAVQQPGKYLRGAQQRQLVQLRFHDRGVGNLLRHWPVRGCRWSTPQTGPSPSVMR